MPPTKTPINRLQAFPCFAARVHHFTTLNPVYRGPCATTHQCYIDLSRPTLKCSIYYSLPFRHNLSMSADMH